MKFIENQEKYGLIYDLKKISKLYNKLKIPTEFDFVDFGRIEENKYIIDMSERTLGKTTNYLLLGLCFNKLYGTKIAYIRTTEDMIKKTYVEKMLETINTYNNGYYIKILTDNQYNGTYYHNKALYYARYDDGVLIDKSDNAFMLFLSCDRHEIVKSTLNEPLLDFIIYDEFISKYYTYNSCFMFMDLLSTIIRKRKSPIIFMLANNLNINSPWFEELTIQKDIRHIKKGQTINITTEQGTKFSVRLMSNTKLEEKKEHNKLFFGLNNPKLNSITGQGDWSVEQVQHIYKDMEYKLINKPFFIRNTINEFIRFQFAIYQNRLIMIVNRATKILDNDIVFTLKSIDEFNNCYFGFGSKKLENKIRSLINTNSIYYSTNEVGADFLNYCYMVYNYKKF